MSVATNDNARDTRIVATYDYTDDGGALLYQKVRLAPGVDGKKSFRHRRPDGAGGWIWSIDDAPRVLYHLPDLLGVEQGSIFVVEGEKDVDRLVSLGLVATTSGGASDWRPEFCRWLAGHDVVILPDNDTPGRKLAQQIADQLVDVASSVRVIELPGLLPKGDVSDWLDAGHTVDDLLSETEAAPRRQPAPCAPTNGVHKVPVWADAPDIVARIRARAEESSISIGLGMSEIARVRAGGIVTLAGPTGAGKSSLAAGLAIRHAREDGWALVLSRELTCDEMGARMIGMQTDRSWEDVLHGHLTDEQMLAVLPDRLRVIDRDDATLLHLDVELARLRVLHPDTPILVVVDYGQIVGKGGEDQRQRVTDVWEHADELSRRHRVVTLMLSQMSRAASRAARGGERLGAEATDGGAESAAIERYSSVVLEIGAAGSEDQYGRREVQLSVAKGRMGGGDRVVPMTYEGRTGRWTVAGESKGASEVRAEATDQRHGSRVSAASLAMITYAERATEPVTREELRAAAAVSRDVTAAAVAALLESGDLVEVHRKRPRSVVWMLWTRSRAEAASVPIVSSGEGGS